MDRHILIAEVHKRPQLWNWTSPMYNDRIPEIWKEVAQIMGVDAEECQRQWISLRDTYRAEVQRIESRIENDMLKGVYHSNKNYKSEWPFFQAMSFINSARRCRNIVEYNKLTGNTFSNDADDHDDSKDATQYNSISVIKLQAHNSMDDDDDILLENLNQASRKLLKESNYLNKFKLRPSRYYQNSFNKEFSQFISLPNDISQQSNIIPLNNFSQYQEQSDRPTTSNSLNFGKSLQHADDHNKLLENLERQEQTLITSNRCDIKLSNIMPQVDDSDYNFLVSFLPQMRKMSELKNLEFRAKMCQIVLNVLEPSINTT